MAPLNPLVGVTFITLVAGCPAVTLAVAGLRTKVKLGGIGAAATLSVVETTFVVVAVIVVVTAWVCGVTVALKVTDFCPTGIVTVAGTKTA